jgi:hypothetical protein
MAILGAENNVNDNLTKRLWHKLYLIVRTIDMSQVVGLQAELLRTGRLLEQGPDDRVRQAMLGLGITYAGVAANEPRLWRLSLISFATFPGALAPGWYE